MLISGTMKCLRLTEPALAQGNAKSLYLLTDTDLKKLGSISKSNPQKK